MNMRELQSQKTIGMYECVFTKKLTDPTFVNSPISILQICPREGVQMIDCHLSEFRAIAVVVAVVVVAVVFVIVDPGVVILTTFSWPLT